MRVIESKQTVTTFDIVVIEDETINPINSSFKWFIYVERLNGMIQRHNETTNVDFFESLPWEYRNKVYKLAIQYLEEIDAKRNL